MRKLTVLREPKKIKNKDRLFNKQSVEMLTSILRQMPPPKNMANQAENIAYKTGTSYGYRDFWSMGYSKNYTIGVWVGKANNQPIVKASAREVATPIMFEAFSILKAIKGLGDWRKSANIANNNPPKVLKYFDKELRQEEKLKFLYPKEMAKYQSASCHKVTVKVAIDKGKAPYYWYVDSKALSINMSRLQLQFKEGAHTISVIDSTGEKADRNIWVNMPDCQK